MSKKRHWLKVLLALVAVALIASAGAGASRMAWWSGYRAGQAASGSEGEALPYGWPPGRGWMPHRGYGFPHPGFGWFWPGSLLRFGALVLALVLVAGFFRRLAWGAAWMAGHRGCSPHAHKAHPRWPHHPHGHPFEGKFGRDEKPDDDQDDGDDKAE
jgi:hypothetical protein